MIKYIFFSDKEMTEKNETENETEIVSETKKETKKETKSESETKSTKFDKKDRNAVPPEAPEGKEWKLCKLGW